MGPRQRPRARFGGSHPQAPSFADGYLHGLRAQLGNRDYPISKSRAHGRCPLPRGPTNRGNGLMPLHKDVILDRLARRGNVAQFVAFRPDRMNAPAQSFARIAGNEPNHLFLDPRQAIEVLLEASADGKVNVRSYLPEEPRSREFVYGLETVDDALAALRRLTSEGLHTIVNETIDICDGGVSGVIQGGTIEFSPDDTPRCVEKPGVASLSFRHGADLLRTVYGFAPELHAADGERTEFSIHPRVRGWRRGHTLLWEHETGVSAVPPPTMRWPNRFSRVVGDKAFGLLIADRLGVPVPRTLVIGRRIAPFQFGRETGSNEVWTRTCPFEPHPGLYTTVKGWTDPFSLLQAEDPEGKVLASVLRQDAVAAGHSGAAIVGPDSELTVEGCRGEGDRLMLGLQLPEPLPAAVTDEVRFVHRRLSAVLGPVRLEWVHDGIQAWIVQLHLGATATAGTTLVPGEAVKWIEFRVEEGLERLRQILDELPSETGLMLIGEVGVTSHIADLVRRANVPARLALRA